MHLKSTKSRQKYIDVRDSSLVHLREKIFENQFNKLSIEVTKEENKDMIYGENVHQC